MADITSVPLTARENFKIVLDFLVESVPEDQLPTADAIFVFGHVDRRLPVHAAKLWRLGKGRKIIIAGYRRVEIPGGFGTEAEYYADIIRSESVPASALVLEKLSTNTLENVTYGMNACRRNWLNPKSLILCAMPALLRRSVATFKMQFPGIKTHGSAFEIPFDEYFEFKSLKSIRRIERVLEELDRLKEYAFKGDIAHTVIPDEVHRAASQIRSIL